MKLAKCKQCGKPLTDSTCVSCGFINLSTEEEIRYKYLTERAEIIYDFYEIKRHRVPEKEKRNVYLNPDLHRRDVEIAKNKIKHGTKWLHANGNVWLVKDVNVNSVSIIIIDQDGIEDTDSLRTLPINVFAATIKNNYYKQTRINKRLLGGDLAPLRLSDLFIRL